ncbi:hypothetical protein P886_4734 [Alteromonadaceae bacterium 2753L.S.0a.02]|nr:hypothetical protein P886_4734 [Alteromonadaceae bacterium 2753L.S.0a.02]
MNFRLCHWAGLAGCAVVVFSGSGSVNADAFTDSSTPLLIAQNDELSEGDIMFGDEFSMESESQTSSLIGNNKLLLGGNRKFIFQHDFAYVFTDPEEVASNRSSLRFQWNKVLWQKLYLNIDIKPIVYLKGDDALDEGEDIDSAFKTKELYGALTLGNTSITVGDKIVIWGEAESTPVTDIISPQNITDLVFTSLDESRISQTMLVVDQYAGRHQFSLIVNPDIKVDEQPSVAQVDLPTELEDKDAEIGLRWKAPIGLGDFSLMAADVVDNNGVPVFTEVDTFPEKIYYKGYAMFGTAANLNLGNTAVKIEAAYNNDRAQALDGEKFDKMRHPKGYATSDEFLLGVNMEYQQNGLRDWNAGILHSEFLDYTEDFSLKEKRLNEIYLGVSNRFYHELIDVGLDYQYEIETKASIGHFMVSYRAADNLSVSLDIFNLDNIDGSFDQGSTIARLIYTF